MKKKNSNKDVLELYYPQTLLPEMPALGWQRFREGTPGGPRPSNMQTYEICYVDKGSVEWWIDEQLYEAGPKSLFINKPGEWHGGASGLIQPCEMYFVQFHFPPYGDLPGLSTRIVLELKKAFETIYHRSFTASQDIKVFFDLLLREQRQPQNFSVTLARAAFHQILTTTARDHARQQTQHYSEGIIEALAWINSHLDQDIYSEKLAEQAQMSLAHFYHRFVQEVGLTPAEYHLRQRMIVAKQKLRGSKSSITNIALELGFSSSQYFSTVFKKVVGVTPKAYRSLRMQTK